MLPRTIRTAHGFLLLALTLGAACPDDKGNSTDSASSSGATDPSAGETSLATEPTSSGSSSSSGGTSTSEGSSTSETTIGPDPAYRRECLPDDFVCDDWGCERPPDVVGGECYKPCTPDGEIGGVDAECDEPERPFCSQAGRSLGGDFDCNGCAHICVSASFNTCQQPKDGCN